MIDRSFFHACAILHGAIETAQNFRELPRLTMINLLDFKPLRSSHTDFHQPISLMYEKGKREPASDIIYMHNIELKKFRKIEFDKDDALHRWLYFLVKGYETINETETKELVKMDRGLEQFAEKYNLSLQDPLIQEKYIHNRLAELDYQTNVDIAHEKGMEQGEVSGMEKMLRLAIKEESLSSSGLQVIAQQAGISNERFEQIQREESAVTSRAKSKKKNQS